MGLSSPVAMVWPKNLCQFAFKGHQAQTSEKVKNLILDLHKSNKPIGALCIAPAIGLRSWKAWCPSHNRKR